MLCLSQVKQMYGQTIHELKSSEEKGWFIGDSIVKAPSRCWDSNRDFPTQVLRFAGSEPQTSFVTVDIGFE